MLQAARESGVSRIVHTSTSEVYGTARQRADRRSPSTAGAVAVLGEQDRRRQAWPRRSTCSFGVPVVTVRPFNTYGPRQSARAVIPTIITQALEGGRIRLGSLAPTRDLVFVDDTVAGFVAAGEAPAAVGRTVNLGTGREIAIGDLAALIGRLMGRTLDIDSEAARLRPEGSEVERLLADATLARSVLGWQARVPLEDGLARTIAWLDAHREAYRPGVYTV